MSDKDSAQAVPAYDRYGNRVTRCPHCGEPADCDMVDVGVGSVQASPYSCDVCQAWEQDDGTWTDPRPTPEAGDE